MTLLLKVWSMDLVALASLASLLEMQNLGSLPLKTEEEFHLRQDPQLISILLILRSLAYEPQTRAKTAL